MSLWQPTTRKVKMIYEDGSFEEYNSIKECTKKNFNGSNIELTKISKVCSGSIKNKKFLTLKNNKSVTFKYSD